MSISQETFQEPDRILTLVEMLHRNAQNFPDKTAIVFKETRISHQALYESSHALAGYLLELGLKKGDRVGYLLEKSPEAIISFLGVAAAGGVVFPFDHFQPVSQLQYVMRLTQPFTIIMEEKFRSVLTDVQLPFPADRIITVNSASSGRRAHGLEQILARGQIQSTDVAIHKDDIVYLNFTSGSTGVPKGAVTTHANVYWNTRSAVESLSLVQDDIHLCMFPVFVHPHELFARTLYLGGTMVLVESLYPKSIVRALTEHNISCMMAIASIYETLIRHREISTFELPFLRVPESGGMHTNATLSAKFKESFGVPMIPVWGSTETCGIALATTINRVDRPGSTGRPCPYYEVKVIGESGAELPPGEIGEMLIRGPGVCTSYYNNPEETWKNMKDGWFCTGDMVSKDAEGHFYFVDRKARMMKVAGMKVYPTEIEEVLISHPDIIEASVVKVRDRLHGEIPRAIIVSQNGLEMDKNLIRRYCEERLPRYKVPRLMEFVDQLPKSPGGKVLWRNL